jgi:hypothetical protein
VYTKQWTEGWPLVLDEIQSFGKVAAHLSEEGLGHHQRSETEQYVLSEAAAAAAAA